NRLSSIALAIGSGMNINWFKKHLIITLLIIISQLFLFYVNLKNNLLIFITILNLIGWLWLE
ncbi:hypothetical protein, partial [Proteus mirabilis]|uniref:hypothetical protein n=1 Tax=Proteus mirabilis TaxID=584 RepID=UPI0019532E5A